MNIEHRQPRFSLTRLLARLVVCVGMLVVFSQFQSVRASIIVPEWPEFTFEDLVAEEESHGGATSSPAPAEPAPEEQPEHSIDALIAMADSVAPLTGANSSSSSSSSTSSNSSSTLAINGDNAVSPDLDLADWLSGECRLSIPMPLGNDLLRPPQAV